MLGRFDTIPESDRQTERQNCYVNIAHQCVNFAHIFPRTAMYSAAHSAMTVRLCLSYFVYYMKRAKKNIPKLYYMLMAYIFFAYKILWRNSNGLPLRRGGGIDCRWDMKKIAIVDRISLYRVRLITYPTKTAISQKRLSISVQNFL